MRTITRSGACWPRAAVLMLVIATAVVHSSLAWAQAVDYGSLEQIFGEPITTSATGKPQRASEVPADMIIITQDDIRRSGADTIPDILQFIPGIDLRRYSFGDAEIAIRGYDSPLTPRMLVLVDGRQVYSDDHGYVAWNAIPVQLSEIRQIEVIRGPNTALFGFNAASGVINIITFDPLLDSTNTATVRGGTQGFGQGEAVATQHFGTTAGVRVSLGGWTATDFPQPVPVSSPSPRTASVNLDGRWQVTPLLLLSASGGATDAHTIRSIGVLTETQNRLSYERFGVVAQTGFGTVDFDAYRNETLLSYTGIAQARETVSVARLSDLVKPDPGDTLRIGAEYRNNTATSAAVGTLSYDVYALTGMWDRLISPSLELTNAARVDHLVLHHEGPPLPAAVYAPDGYDVSFTAPSFNASLVVHLADQDTVRLLLARGLQLPSLDEFGTRVLYGDLALYGSPLSVPEAVWNAELAYSRPLPWLGATADVSVFFQRNTQILQSPGDTAFNFVGGRLTSIAGNVGSSNEIGAELALHGQFANGVRWSGSYRLTTIKDDLDHDVTATSTTAFATGTPRHVVTLGVGYTHGPWEIDAHARGQSAFTDYQNFVTTQRVPAYLTAELRVGYRVTGSLTLSGTAEQLNTPHLLVDIGSTIDRRLIVAATLHY